MRLIILSFLMTTFSSLGAQRAYLEEFKQKWKNAAEYTIEIAEMMPEDQYDFRPAPGMRSFREQVMHMMSNMTWLSSSYLSKQSFEHDLKKKDYSKAEMLELLKTSTKFAADIVDQLDPKVMEQKVDFFAGPMSKRQILTLMNDHFTHHRGQIIVYLRLNGFKPPRYRGW